MFSSSNYILRCQDLIIYELVMERILHVNVALKGIYVAILAFTFMIRILRIERELNENASENIFIQFLSYAVIKNL